MEIEKIESKLKLENYKIRLIQVFGSEASRTRKIETEMIMYIQYSGASQRFVLDLFCNN